MSAPYLYGRPDGGSVNPFLARDSSDEEPIEANAVLDRTVVTYIDTAPFPATMKQSNQRSRR